MEVHSTEQQAASSRRDTALLILAALALLGSMFAFYYFQGQFNALIRMLMLLGGIAAGLALAYQTALGRSLWGYVSGARTEARKVIWPTRQESLQATLMVGVVVLVVAVLLWGLDTLLLWGVEALTGRGA